MRPKQDCRGNFY